MSNFFGTEILEDASVLLRPLQLSDVDHLLPFALNEPEIWTYSLISGAGKQNLENYIRVAVEARDTCREIPFIVYDKRKQQYAGSTRFYDIQPGNKTLQLGYTWYGKNFRGTGLNKHCKFLLLDYAFDQLGMERVEFRADERNARSIAAMQSIGCVLEGVLRSNGITSTGDRRSSVILSILKNEWISEVKERLKNKIYK